MKLHYENNVEDLVAFSRYFHERGPLVKQQARSMATVTFMLAGITIFMMSPWNWLDVPYWLFVLSILVAAALAASLAIATYFLWRPYVLYNIGKAVRKLYKHDPDKVAFGPRELEVDSGYLIERNDYGEFRWKIGVIEQITGTAEHVFIRISSMRAYILPRSCFHPEELEAFLDELERQHAQPPPLEGRPEPVGDISDAIQSRRLNNDR